MLLRAALLLSFAAAVRGTVVLDRLAVVVGRHAIKLSDIRRDVRVTEFMNREPFSFNTAAMRQSAERLIDQTIIRDAITTEGYRRASDADATALLNQFRQNRFGGSDRRLRENLARYGLTEEQLREQLLWQLTVLRFIDQRFRPGVQVSDEDVRTYWEQHAAEFKHGSAKNASFESLEPKIRASLEGQRINQSFEQWLEESRKQNRIEYKQGAFENEQAGEAHP
jgi:hypothetical protein